MRVAKGGTYDKTEKCGCEVRWAPNALVDGINFCPPHAAAPALLEALEECLAALEMPEAQKVLAFITQREIAHVAITQAQEVPTEAQ